jgi:hypothetical protein
MCGAIPPLLNMSSWRGALLSTGTALHLPLPYLSDVKCKTCTLNAVYRIFNALVHSHRLHDIQSNLYLSLSPELLFMIVFCGSRPSKCLHFS